MNRTWAVLAVAFCLTFGCGKASTGGGDDTGGGGGGGGGGDTGLWGPRGLDVLAGALGGPGNLDGTGAAARFIVLYNVTWDGAGNLYVSDGSNVFRKIVAATGAVTTVPVQVSQYSGVHFAVSDGAGNLYTSTGQEISKLELSSGLVTAVAGDSRYSGSEDGTGAKAHFRNVTGLAWDGAGSLYVADTGNSTIRKIVVATGVVTTLAGSPGSWGSADGTGSAAGFYSPQGVATDGAGNVYVSDTDNHTIRKIVVATGEVTTIAGTASSLTPGFMDGTGAAAVFYKPTGLAWDGAGSLYVTEPMAVRKLVVATGVVTTVAGTMNYGKADGTGPAASFLRAWSLTPDGAGNMYVSDLWTVRKLVTATGAVTTLAGLAGGDLRADGTGLAARFAGPTGVAWDGAGNLYVADTTDFTIRKIVAKTGVVTTLAGTTGTLGNSDGTGTAARFYQPMGIASDGAGNLYVTDKISNTIRQIVTATGVVTTIAGAAGTAGSSDGTGAAARFNFPSGLTSDGTGNLYVADANNRIIRKIVVATGEVTTLAGSAGLSEHTDGTGAAARFRAPVDVAWDGAGNLYVADEGSIRKIVVATGVVSTVAGGAPGITKDGIGTEARFLEARGLAADGAGNLYIADGQTVRKLVTATGAVTTVLGVNGRMGVLPGAFPGNLNYAYRLAVIPNQGLVITDGIEKAVLIARGL